MTESILINEMTDCHGDNIKIIQNNIKRGVPFVVYTKNPFLLPPDMLDYPKVALFVSVTGWGGSWLEPGVPGFQHIEQELSTLFANYGHSRIHIRVDPIIPTRVGANTAKVIASSLIKMSGGNVNFIASIYQIYKKNGDLPKKLGLNNDFYTVKSGYGLYVSKDIADRVFKYVFDGYENVSACGMPYEVASTKEHNGCISEDVLKSIGITEFKRIPPGVQRPGCRCVIKKKQMFNKFNCTHGCAYCYAK